MTLSLGEIQALAVKAARGSGLSWGLAEEAGYAVRWLQAHSLPGTAALAGYLAWQEERDGKPDAVCPLKTGAEICDSAKRLSSELPYEVQLLAFPLLALPFAAGAAESMGGNAPFQFRWDDVAFVLCGEELARSGDENSLLQQLSTCRLSRGTVENALPCPAATRVPESAENMIFHLEGYAARTYAPASERSRLIGAGAGTDDQN